MRNIKLSDEYTEEDRWNDCTGDHEDLNEDIDSLNPERVLLIKEEAGLFDFHGEHPSP